MKGSSISFQFFSPFAWEGPLPFEFTCWLSSALVLSISISVFCSPFAWERPLSFHVDYLPLLFCFENIRDTSMANLGYQTRDKTNKPTKNCRTRLPWKAAPSHFSFFSTFAWEGSFELTTWLSAALVLDWKHQRYLASMANLGYQTRDKINKTTEKKQALFLPHIAVWLQLFRISLKIVILPQSDVQSKPKFWMQNTPNMEVICTI